MAIRVAGGGGGGGGDASSVTPDLLVLTDPHAAAFLADRLVTAVPDAGLTVGETVILLHPPLPLVGVSVLMERERQQNDSLANGYAGRLPGLGAVLPALQRQSETVSWLVRGYKANCSGGQLQATRETLPFLAPLLSFGQILMPFLVVLQQAHLELADFLLLAELELDLRTKPSLRG